VFTGDLSKVDDSLWDNELAMQDKTWFNYQGTTTNVILMMSL
jgi:hypothetical protein